MVRLLLLAALAAFASVVCAHPWIHPRTHVGALNHRLSREELFRTAQPADPIQPQWMTQQLDHNDLSSTATFQQRYFVNDTFWTPSAPIVFFMIGGEGPVSPAYVGDHFIIGELAATFGAMIVTLEHRFYGQSVPNGDSSTANLKYLSSSAALEDMVTFRQHMMDTRSMSANTKWIVFGGSYSGALAGFARAKYPNLWMGAFATSAPVQAQLDFSQYFEVVAQSVGADCTANIAASTATLTQLLASNRAQLVSDFNLCAAPANDNDAMNFVSTLSGPISGIVQYNDDNNAYEMYDIPIMCSKLMGADNALDGLKTVWNDYNAFSNNTACTDISYAGMIASMQPTSDARSWTWQTCNEFGYFQSAEGTSQPFSSLISLQSFLQQCVDIFGIPNFTPNTRFINDYYGGNQIVSTNTVFANGDVDPWHILGNYQTYEPAAASDTILIHGTAHCADLYPARAADVSGLTQARRTQASLLAIWLDSEASAPAAAPAASKKPAAAHKPKIVLKHE